MISVALFAVLSAFLAGPAQAAWQDSPEIKALYEKAKAEGKVAIWGPQRNEVDWVPAALRFSWRNARKGALGPSRVTVCLPGTRTRKPTRHTGAIQ